MDTIDRAGRTSSELLNGFENIADRTIREVKDAQGWVGDQLDELMAEAENG